MLAVFIISAIRKLLLGRVFGSDAEGDCAVINVVGKSVNHHGKNHNDILAGLLHREEGNDAVAQVLPAQALKENPADAKLQSKTDEEAAYKEEQFTAHVILGLEDPITVPQETVNDTEDVARDVGDTVGKPEPGVENIESNQGDERVQHAYHSILEQLNASLSGLGFIYLHDNSF